MPNGCDGRGSARIAPLGPARVHSGGVPPGARHPTRGQREGRRRTSVTTPYAAPSPTVPAHAVPSTVPPLPADVVGEGPPVVLLHGFGLSPRTYRKTAVELAERAGVLVAAPWLFAVDG